MKKILYTSLVSFSLAFGGSAFAITITPVTDMVDLMALSFFLPDLKLGDYVFGAPEAGYFYDNLGFASLPFEANIESLSCQFMNKIDDSSYEFMSCVKKDPVSGFSESILSRDAAGKLVANEIVRILLDGGIEANDNQLPGLMELDLNHIVCLGGDFPICKFSL